MENTATFQYTYSAAQNQEVLAIRQKYLPREENGLEELQRLDARVRHAGIPESLSLGIIGCLIFGIGLCLILEVMGNVFRLGIAVGILGLAIMLPAYPLFRRINEKTRSELTPRILELANELSMS